MADARDITDLPQHEGLEARIAAAIAPTLGAMGYELVRVQVQGKERPTVQVMADRADGSLIGVSDCEAISHAVGAVMDVDDPFPGLWSLEVSSAGIDRPLTRTKDWTRFLGHAAIAELHVPQDGRRHWRGRILSADEENVVLKPEDGGEAVTIPRAVIRRAKLVLTDELIAATATVAPEEAEGLPQRWRPPTGVASTDATPTDGDTPSDPAGDPASDAVPGIPRRGPGRFAAKNAARIAKPRTTKPGLVKPGSAKPGSAKKDGARARPPSERN